MTPQEALEAIAELCRTATDSGWVHRDDVRRVLAAVGPSLTLNDAEARILLALIDRAPLPEGAFDELAAITGRLQAIAPATGTHAAVDPDDW